MSMLHFTDADTKRSIAIATTNLILLYLVPIDGGGCEFWFLYYGAYRVTASVDDVIAAVAMPPDFPLMDVVLADGRAAKVTATEGVVDGITEIDANTTRLSLRVDNDVQRTVDIRMSYAAAVALLTNL